MSDLFIDWAAMRTSGAAKKMASSLNKAAVTFEPALCESL
jgi:hypothetical protein